MPGFSNSLSHFYGIHAIRIRYSNSYIQQLHKSLMICLNIRSISVRVSDLQYLQFCNNLWWTDCWKFAQPIHPSTATALPPSNLQWMQIRDFQSRTQVWPFPNPKTQVYRRNLGLETLIKDYKCVNQHVSVTTSPPSNAASEHGRAIQEDHQLNTAQYKISPKIYI